MLAIWVSHALGRVTGTTLDGASIAAYTYDRDGNRLTKTDGGTTYTATYDRTDAQATQNSGTGPVNLTYDSSGNLTTEIRAGGSTRSYGYDAANRLTLIDDPSGNDAALAYDPLDRLRTRTLGSDVQTQSYVGTSELAWRQAGSVTTTALVDAAGARVGSKSGATASWLLFDLLGSVAGLEGSAATAVTDAFRYDAYGQTIGRYPAGGSAVPVRFRGLLDIGPTADPDTAGAGSDPSYLMGDRIYSPHLGSFTQLDSYAGDAQNPLSMNRFLYALANPATLIDPTGHIPCTGHNDSTCDSYAMLPPAQQQAIQKKWEAQDKQAAKKKQDEKKHTAKAQQVPSSVPPDEGEDWGDAYDEFQAMFGGLARCRAGESAVDCAKRSKPVDACQLFDPLGLSSSPFGTCKTKSQNDVEAGGGERRASQPALGGVGCSPLLGAALFVQCGATSFGQDVSVYVSGKTEGKSSGEAYLAKSHGSGRGAVPLTPGEPHGPHWVLGAFKSLTKWANQMAKRGWTFDQIDEAIRGGAQIRAQNNVHPLHSATRYVHPETGRSVVVDDVTHEVLQVGGDGFRY